MKYTGSTLFAVLVLSLSGVQDPASGIRPTATSLMKAAEKKPLQNEEPAPAKQSSSESVAVINDSMIMIDGALYFRADDTIYPIPGGGASGCFEVNPLESRARVERARAAFAKTQK